MKTLGDEFGNDDEIEQELTKEFQGGNNVDLQRPPKRMKRQFKYSTIQKFHANQFKIEKNEINA
eukprot:CAMPEP_0170567390 /NCGR_PEP_ID=MMETSP0211-20121228/80447_1 /TAXON_ID=311385 /ORGANISM="Pseudokeronopsis sp., Strain OXSARD2" /LENGTH=63 /DNA_ID=CAMNT_0010888827 /DNA_START=908 /DNA_END=1095 /DNA_ORIENTATION=+